MEYIEKNNSLETAKNRLYISGLTYVTSITGTTQYVHDRCVVGNTDDVIKQFLPLVEASGNSNEYILRYKNLVRQYYWLINKFIPSCTTEKVCMRKSKKTLVPYNDPSKTKEQYKEHVVNYYYIDDDDNEILISTITVIEGEKARNFDPNKICYDFEGWLDENDNTFDFDTPITEMTNLYTKYSRQTFTLIFHLNNGESDNTMSVNYGETPEIADPTKQGSEFMGWNPSLAPATANTEYNATYSTDVYSVTFHNIRKPDDLLDDYYYEYQPIDGGDNTKYSITETEDVQYNEASEYYQVVPTYRHFTFDGWINLNGETITNGEFEHVHSEINAYPKLRKNIYTVNFYVWDDDIADNRLIDTQNVVYIGDAEPPTAPSKPNYTFVGWSSSYTGITHDTSLFAEYTGDALTYEYLLPNSPSTGYILYRSGVTHYNSTIPSVPSPGVSEYDPHDYGVFDGWYTDSQYQHGWDSTSLVTDNTTIYGKWKTEFEVSFYNSDNTFISGATENPVYVGYEGSVPQSKLDDIEANVDVPSGFLFVGWNKSTNNITRDTKVTAKVTNLQE